MHWIWIITCRSPLFPPGLHTGRTHAPPANNISISPRSVLRPLHIQMMIGSAWTGQPVLLSLALHRSNVHLNRQIATVTHLKHKVGVRGHLVFCLENGYHLLAHKDEHVPKRKTEPWIMTRVGMIAVNPLNERWEWFLKIWNQFKHFHTAIPTRPSPRRHPSLVWRRSWLGTNRRPPNAFLKDNVFWPRRVFPTDNMSPSSASPFFQRLLQPYIWTPERRDILTALILTVHGSISCLR